MWFRNGSTLWIRRAVSASASVLLLVGGDGVSAALGVVSVLSVVSCIRLSTLLHERLSRHSSYNRHSSELTQPTRHLYTGS